MAEDLCRNVVTKNLSITVQSDQDENAAPYFTTSSVISVKKAGKFSIKIAATDPDGDNMEFGIQNLPSWLKFNTKKQILSGKARVEENGTHNFTITVADPYIEQPVSQEFALVVQIEEGQDDISEAGSSSEIWRKVSASSDDAEEVQGQVSLFSSDLEMVEEKDRQTIGIRFTDLTIPKNATIEEARIIFVSDEENFGATELQVFGEASSNPKTFSKIPGNISDRSLSKSFSNWNPEGWSQSNNKYSSPSLISIVSELIHQIDWRSGNSMAFIIKGLGKRVAQTYDKNPDAAPQLYIKYRIASEPEVKVDQFQFKSFPNPFSEYVKMEFVLDSEQDVEISIMDINGRFVEDLLQAKTLGAGLHNYHWETGSRFKSLQKTGIYIIKIRIGKRLEFRKMIFSSH
jgi:hypothetical protein